MKQSPFTQLISFLNAQNWEEAQKTLENAPSHISAAPQTLFWQGFLSFLKGDHQNAHQTYLEAIQKSRAFYFIPLQLQTAPPTLLTHYLNYLYQMGQDSTPEAPIQEVLQLVQLAFSVDLELAKEMALWATKKHPKSHELQHLLGHIYLALGQTESALGAYRSAYQSHPTPHLLLQLAKLYHTRGQTQEARDIFNHLYQHSQNDFWKLRAHITTTPLFSSREALEIAEHQISQAIQDIPPQSLAPSVQEASMTDTLFDWYYHRPVTRSMHQSYHQRFIKSLPPPLPASVPNRLGVIITQGHEGAFLHSQKELFAHLSEDIEPLFFCTESGKTLLMSHLKKGRFMSLSGRHAEDCETIRQTRCQWLYFWEVGTDPSNFYLARERLAEIQIASWGTPGSTGAPEIDYFFSCRLIEPENAQGHYSETLLLSEQLQMNYPDPRAEMRGTPTREDYGFSKNQPIYLCPHNIQKLHPDFDRVFKHIVKKEPHSVIVLVEHTLDRWNQMLQQRLLSQGLTPKNLVFFKPLPRQAFLGLIAISDLVLDTWYFGAGKLAFECLGLGKLMVTWPGPSMRGRIVAGCYTQMGRPDLIASSQSDYLEKTLSWMNNPTWRTQQEHDLLTKRKAIIGNTESSQAFENLLRQSREQKHKY